MSGFLSVNRDEDGFLDAAETMAENLCRDCARRPDKEMEIYDVPCGEWYTCGNFLHCENYRSETI